MKSRTVSTVIPTFNRALQTEALVSMILSQDYRPIELIIVDDGSEDDTFLRLEKCTSSLEKAGVQAHFCKTDHSGQDAATMEGLKYVSGDYFFWCDDDDILSADALSSKVEWLESHPECGMVRCDAEYVEKSSGRTLRRAYTDARLKCSDILEHLLDDTMPPLAGTYMMRTSLLDLAIPGRILPLCGEGQNLQLLIPAAMHSECGYLDKVGLKYVLHGDSHSHKGRSLGELLLRNERFRELKLKLLGTEAENFANLVNERHDRVRNEILESASTEARKLSRRC